jgi:hypothetical protein
MKPVHFALLGMLISCVRGVIDLTIQRQLGLKRSQRFGVASIGDNTTETLLYTNWSLSPPVIGEVTKFEFQNGQTAQGTVQAVTHTGNGDFVASGAVGNGNIPSSISICCFFLCWWLLRLL